MAIANLKVENSDERQGTFCGARALRFAPFLRRDKEGRPARRDRCGDSRWCRQLRLSARSRAKRRRDAALQEKTRHCLRRVRASQLRSANPSRKTFECCDIREPEDLLGSTEQCE